MNTGTYYYARILRRSATSHPAVHLGGRGAVVHVHVEFPWVSDDNLRMYYTNELPTGWVIRMATRVSRRTVDEGTVLTALGASVIKQALTSDELAIFFTALPKRAAGRLGHVDGLSPGQELRIRGLRNLSEINGPFKTRWGPCHPTG